GCAGVDVCLAAIVRIAVTVGEAGRTRRRAHAAYARSRSIRVGARGATRAAVRRGRLQIVTGAAAIGRARGPCTFATLIVSSTREGGGAWATVVRVGVGVHLAAVGLLVAVAVGKTGCAGATACAGCA